MEQVIRFDAPGEVLSREVGPDGSVRATADVARCGIYEYRRSDGSTLRELVLPEHLFDPDSLRTLASVAVTAYPPTGHPPELVTPDNAEQYAAGHVHETIDAVDSLDERDFGYVRVRFSGRTRKAVDKLNQSKLYTSPGYTLPHYDVTPGVHPFWGPYDAIQGPRVYNHLALTDTPRGGDHMVVHMDAAADADVGQQIRSDPAGVDEEKWEKATEVASEAGESGNYAYVVGAYKKMGGTFGGSRVDSQEVAMGIVAIRLDGIGREVRLDETAAEVVRQELERRDADAKSYMDKYEAMKADMSTMQKEVDALKEKINEAMKGREKAEGERDAEKAKAEEDAKRADAAEATLKDVTKLREVLAPRVALETTARQWLPDDQHARIDSMEDDEIRRSVTRTLLPGLEVDDDVSGDRLDGMYRTALATRQARRDPVPPTRDPRAPSPQTDGRFDSRRAQEERIDSEYVSPGRGRAA